MTKDFRHVGRIPDPQSKAAGTTGRPPEGLHSSRRIVLFAIQFAAIGFFAAGIWLLTGGRSPLPDDISPYIGIALVVTAMADLVVVVILKRIWSR
jgi:hypothetical protein